jgi:hypothetical protein
LPVAAVLGQIADDSVHSAIVGRVNERPSILTLQNESSGIEFL